MTNQSHRWFVSAVLVATLFSAAVGAARADYAVSNVNFAGVADGTVAQTRFDPASLIVDYGQSDTDGFGNTVYTPLADPANPLTIQTNGARKVLGDGQNLNGAYLFQLQKNLNFRSLSFDMVPSGSAFASTTAQLFLGDLAGVVLPARTITLDETKASTITLTAGQLAGIGTVVFPSDVQYTNFSLQAATVPEPATLALFALAGGAVIARRRRK